MPNRPITGAMAFLLIVSLSSPAARGEFLAEGCKLERLTDDGRSRAIAGAYHGDKIACLRDVSGGTQSQIVIMNADGSAPEAVTPIGNPFFAEWSWRGDKLAYEFTNAATDESQGGVFLYDLATKRTLPISDPCVRDALDENDGPGWSSDDRFVAYVTRPGPSHNRQFWVFDTQTGKSSRLLPDRGQMMYYAWGPALPARICTLLEADGDTYDVATVGPDGGGLTLLTDVGASSVRTDDPGFSPDGAWVCYTSDLDMTQAEREGGREDVWVARPDGSEARNLTRATSPVTEEQLMMRDLFWSWDSRWILAEGWRFDNQGNEIPTYFLVDPIEGGYRAILTSDPREKGLIHYVRTAHWSYDSKKILFLTRRYRVKNWGPEPQLEDPHRVLQLYDVEEDAFQDLLVYNEQLDRKRILGTIQRNDIEDISWSPDNRSVILTIEEVLSADGNVAQPDVYRLDLPAGMVHASAHEHIGPPMGRDGAARLALAAPPPAAAVLDREIATETAPTSVSEASVPSPDASGNVTDVIRPTHMTITEAMASLPANYASYVTPNQTRNLLLFKGPRDALDEMRSDLARIDTEPPHILVDLLAVELSDEANRNLGLDWTYAEGRFAFFQPGGNAVRDLIAPGQIEGIDTYPGVGQSFYQGVGKLPREFFVRLNSLVNDGEATVLANPRTVAMSDKESLIQIRRTVNFFFNEGYDTSGRPVVKKSDISAVTEGKITPTLLPDGRIRMVADVSVGTFTFSQAEGLPEQTTRKSTTEVTVRAGDSIVIGGLRQQEMSKSITRTPLLGYIPYLKAFFTRAETHVQHSVLTIFITPTLLDSESPTPKWPTLQNGDHKVVPIMDDEAEQEAKNQKRKHGWLYLFGL